MCKSVLRRTCKNCKVPFVVSMVAYNYCQSCFDSWLDSLQKIIDEEENEEEKN